MFRFFIKFIADSTGALAPITAVVLPLVIGIMGMGVDVSFWMMNRRNLQAAADAAVIAGAWEISYGFSEEFAEDAGLKEAVNNGYEDVAGNSYDMEFGEDDDNNTTITAVLTARDDKYFSSFLFHGDVYSTVAAATAVILPDNDFCMLSLAPTGPGALTFSGNITVDSPGCGLAVNSNDPNAALNVNGNSASITVGDVLTVGGISDDHDTIHSTGETTGVPPFKDPYDDLELETYTRCTNAQVNAGPVKVSQLPLAADANGVRVMCGGFLVKNNETVNAAQLPAGIYIVEGGIVDIKGSVTATGVTFILTNSQNNPASYAQIQVTGNFSITAPTPGSLDPDWDMYEGIAIYQDRNATATVQCNQLSQGNATTLIDGVAYFPSQCLNVGGGSSVQSGNMCSRIIALTITVHGNPNMANNCAGKGVEDIEGGIPQIKLIL